MTTTYTVQQGDCINSIAHDHGLLPKTIWDDPGNQSLRESRSAPNLLMPGDKVVVPDLRRGEESKASDSRHRFRRKGVPAMLRLQFFLAEHDDEDDQGQGKAPANDALHTRVEDPDPPEAPEPEPRADVPYILVIEGDITEGKTDKDGKVEIELPPNARQGEITLEPGTPQETKVPLMLGQLDPIEEDSGVAQRLSNLGYPATKEPKVLASAVEEFQVNYDLDPTGKLDDATRSKINEVHGE